MSDTHQLKRGLKNRHVQLLAIGVHWYRLILRLRSCHSLGRSIHYFRLPYYRYYLLLHHESIRRIVIIQLESPLLYRLRGGLFRWSSCLYHRMDILVLLAFTSHGRLDGRRPLYAVLDTVAATVDTSLDCPCRLAINEFNSCKIFRRNGVLVCLD